MYQTDLEEIGWYLRRDFCYIYNNFCIVVMEKIDQSNYKLKYH